MHYHPIPQMPGDFWILCDEHMTDKDDPDVYVCDCSHNQCYVCEENEQVENPQETESKKETDDSNDCQS